ncbi:MULTISPECIES: CPBP family intramembrane glutamic endopeptidase [Thermomonosporaceae]|uniref:CPBP family intramembrane glutamic endopeptidase n=1 Tax=Thermomonosporaceae TaxID=2012 RepID=UPI00255A9DE3|nr:MULTISPECIES: CPBP family intramembrane glutamic endopeptidase [Thermomonosporaceae]MDL4772615.1 CPBP family intramembrane metalloprotease [Actinomadura xylanilytica]
MQITPDFSPLGLALAAPLVAYLVIVESVYGKRSYERLRRTRDHDPRALTRMFTRWIADSWALTGVAAVIVLVSPGVRAADVGLAPPDDMSAVLGMLTGLALMVVITAVLFHLRARSGRAAPGQGAYAAMLPRTRAERGAALAMSVTAGVCEELVFRGLLIALGVAAGLDLTTAAGAALAVFVLGHLYQGWKGMLAVAALGYLFTATYLATGSLLVPIVAHILIDVRGLVVMPAPARPVPSRPVDAVPQAG